MMIKKFNLILFFFYFFFLFTFRLNSVEFKTLASVDNNIITNYDLIIEIKLNEIVSNKKITDNQKNAVIESLINNKIKELEIKKKGIKTDEKLVTNNLMKLVDISKIDQNLIDELLKRLEIEFGWKRLIFLEYANKLEINLSEIKEIKKNMEINDNDQKLIQAQKNRKLQIASTTYLNKIRNNYLIKKY